MLAFIIQFAIMLSILAQGFYSNTKPKNIFTRESVRQFLNLVKYFKSKVPVGKIQEEPLQDFCYKGQPAEIIISSLATFNSCGVVNFKDLVLETGKRENGGTADILQEGLIKNGSVLGSLGVKMGDLAQNALSFETEKTKVSSPELQVLNSKNVSEDFFDFYTEQIKIRPIRRQICSTRKTGLLADRQILLINPLISAQVRELILKKLVHVSRKIKMQRNCAILEIVHENAYLENLF